MLKEADNNVEQQKLLVEFMKNMRKGFVMHGRVFKLNKGHRND